MVEVNATPAQVKKPSAAVKPVGENVELLPGEHSAEEAKEMLATHGSFDRTDRAIEGRVVMLAEGQEPASAETIAEVPIMEEAIAKRARFDALGQPVVTSGYYNPVKLMPVNPDELAPMDTVVAHPDSKVIGSHDLMTNKPAHSKVTP